MSRNSRIAVFATAGLLMVLISTAAIPQTSNPESWTLAEWISWRDKEITSILEPAISPNGEKILRLQDVVQRSSEAYKVIDPCLRDDPAFFSANPERSAALSNFVRFIIAQHWMGVTSVIAGSTKNTHALGMEITDSSYWKVAQPYVGFPDLLQNQRFLSDMSSPSTYALAQAMIDDQNRLLPPERKWITLFFKTQFITTVDDAKTYGRFLILIPNEPLGTSGTVDRWIVFGIATPEMNRSTPMRSVSMFTVYRGGADSSHTQTFFSDFMRTKDPVTDLYALTSNFVQLNDPSHNCYSCHKSSALPIHPATEYEFDSQHELAPKLKGSGTIPDIVNGRIIGYGQPDFGPIDTTGYGPCLGPVDQYRSDRFIQLATAELDVPLKSYDTIRRAMRCTNCHDNFATINYPQALRTDLDPGIFLDPKGMVHTFISKGYMPPGSTLSPLEREAVWRCLMLEYYDPNTEHGLLISWLEGDSPVYGKLSD